MLLTLISISVIVEIDGRKVLSEMDGYHIIPVLTLLMNSELNCYFFVVMEYHM